MSEINDVVSLFELELELPDARITAASKRLIGFEARYQRLQPRPPSPGRSGGAACMEQQTSS